MIVCVIEINILYGETFLLSHRHWVIGFHTCKLYHHISIGHWNAALVVALVDIVNGGPNAITTTAADSGGGGGVFPFYCCQK